MTIAKTTLYFVFLKCHSTDTKCHFTSTKCHFAYEFSRKFECKAKYHFPPFENRTDNASRRLQKNTHPCPVVTLRRRKNPCNTGNLCDSMQKTQKILGSLHTFSYLCLINPNYKPGFFDSRTP